MNEHFKPADGNGFFFAECEPAAPGTLTIVALHGSGADEQTMIPLARGVAPEARIVSVRGRIDQAGERRWFLKNSPVSFDQDSICREAAAFARFLPTIAPDPDRTVFIGYSNGGNLLSATALLHPGLIRQAVLLRCMPVLHHAPATRLDGTRFLVIRGRDDATYGPYSVPLVRMLRYRGARTSLATVAGGHLFAEQDAALIRRWLRPLAPR